jgi:RNA recognition motif-containing protein
LKELLSTVGQVSSADVEYDRAGRSTGAARATFNRRSDALEAIKKFNGAEVDGKVLSIELAASNARKPRREAETETPTTRQASRFVRVGSSGGRGGRGGSRGRGGFGFGRSRGRGRRGFFNR